VSENRALRRIYGSKMKLWEAGEDCIMRAFMYIARMGRMKNMYKSLVGTPEGKRTLRPVHRWKDNIRIDIRAIGWETVSWIHLAQNRDQWRHP
jgi:hypothetical protein